MGDEAHVGLIDAHAEGDGRHHYDAVFAQKALLILLAHACVQACMVGQRGQAAACKPFGGFVDFLARQAIDDAGGAVMRAEKFQQLLARIVAFDHGIANIRAVEAGNEDLRRFEPEPLGDLFACHRVGGGGERDARHLRIAFVQLRELDVFGTEIVSPLRNAMRFVDRE